MTDRAVPHLPSRDFEATVAFYGGFGFRPTYRDSEWLIMERGDLQLEFFPFAQLDPARSSFMCGLRVDDLDALYAAVRASGVAECAEGHPRLHAPSLQPWGRRVAHLIDLDGTQVNLIENEV
jgi:catechol 2,3-dioxygenase-like lactoylglutathione lyase family enzyme